MHLSLRRHVYIAQPVEFQLVESFVCWAENYCWQELPQVSFLSRQATTQNTSFVATKVCLPQQNHVYRDVCFFCDKIKFAFSRQT